MNKQERADLVEYRTNRAKETFNEVKTLIENEFWNTAVNRLYYSCYYIVSALLIMNEIKAQTHSGVRQLFGLHFIKTGKISRELGKFYSDLFDKRQTGDYDDFIDFDRETVEYLMPLAKELIDKLEKLIKK